MKIKSERLTYWYFRLNGFLGNDNYIIHRRLKNQDHATEIDYLGVRFVHRKELYNPDLNEWMKDDSNSELFKYYPKDKIYICLVESKRELPSINQSWTNNPENLVRILQTLGIISFKHHSKVVRRLKEHGYCSFNRFYITFIAVGITNEASYIPFENIPIISWKEVLSFIYERFRDNQKVKSHLQEWEEFSEIKELVDLIYSNSKEEFIDKIEIN